MSGLKPSWPVGSWFPNCVPCIARQSLNPWTTMEVPTYNLSLPPNFTTHTQLLTESLTKNTELTPSL